MRSSAPIRYRFVLRFAAFLSALSLLFAIFCALPPKEELPAQGSAPTLRFSGRTVILDAGHGGEDGGAVSADGVFEKDLNLQVTLLVRDLLLANGVSVILTRDRDVLLYDPSGDYLGHKKEQDLATRLRIAEQVENGIFVSIHMNAFPQTQYHGLQVWYSPNDSHSQLLAQTVQTTVQAHLQPQNARRIKAASDSIFLLHNLRSPAILIECGFLSNPSEAALLASPSYQQQLALLIFLSIMRAETA